MVKIARAPTEYEYDKAVAEYEAALTLSSGVIPPAITKRDGKVFLGNDATGLSIHELRSMTAKLRKL
jgi:hypothetical protein